MIFEICLHSPDPLSGGKILIFCCLFVFDATHSVQAMGGAGGSSGGSRQYVPALVRAAVAAGVDGVFLECHEEPERAPSDSATMLPLKQVPEIIEFACNLREILRMG